MRILFIHQNFPGQFRHIAQSWARQPGLEVLGLSRRTAPGMDGVSCLTYELHRSASQGQHPYLRQMEDAVLHGQAVARALLKLRAQGFVPDVIMAHPGWGETLYAKDIFPDTKLIHFCEWYYGTTDGDAGFDPEFPSSFDAQARMRTWNALHALNLAHCDIGTSPTQWQRSRHPTIFQPKIHLAHEGVDTQALGPDPQATVTLPNGHTVKAGEPVITYVARNLEPYRGFHSFMRALQRVQQAHRHCHTIIVGGDDISYGSRPKNAANWREKMLAEVSLDPTRTHFLGKVPYNAYRQILQVSAAHVYLTYPFVLSWSCLEAMASGCMLIGSRTAPVREVIEHGRNGWLVDFFDPVEMARTMVDALEAPQAMAPMRAQARIDVMNHYSFEAGEQAYRRLLDHSL